MADCTDWTVKSWIPGISLSREDHYGDYHLYWDRLGNVILVDGGEPTAANKIISFLKARGMTTLTLVLTHAHYDHSYGIKKILQDKAFSINALYCIDPSYMKPRMAKEYAGKSWYKELCEEYRDNGIKPVELAKKRGIPVIYAVTGMEISIGYLKGKVFCYKGPFRADGNHVWTFINDSSLQIMWAWGEYTGGDAIDGASYFARQGAFKGCVLAKAPHHGNGYPSELWQGTRPKAVWYNYSEPRGINSSDYCHLSKPIAGGSKIWSNFRHGALTMTVTSDSLKIESEKGGSASYSMGTFAGWDREPPVRKLYRVRQAWDQPETQVGAYSILDNAIARCDQDSGLQVFDWTGQLVHISAKDGVLVKVSVEHLRIRAGAGTSYEDLGYIRPGLYTVTEQVKAGGYTWGRLKSGAGWIAMDYVDQL